MTALLAPGQPVPAGIAWSTLAVCGLTAVLGGFSMQAHLLAASDLGGVLGLSADEASWVPTAGAAAEGAAVLLAAPLTGALGVRRILTLATTATGCLALLGLLLPQHLVAVRFAQGFACSLLPVVMMTWAMRAFPPDRRSLPLMLFAFASSFPSAFAALVIGYATDHWGGTGALMLDLLWTPLVALAAYHGLPREAARAGSLRALDWLGFVLLAGGVMLVVVWLQQGERRFWLETVWMAPLIAAGLGLLALAIIRLLTAALPWLDLSLLGRTTFAFGMAEALSLRFGLLMASFAVPQALMRLQGFRAEQSGQAVLWLALGQLVGFPLAWAWLRKRDPRWTLAAGLGVFTLAALWAAQVNPFWQIEQFVGPMTLAGLGQGLFLTSVMTFATAGVPATAGATAAGMFNLVRVLGTSTASATVAYGLRIRENGHSAVLTDNITSASQAVSARLEDLTRSYTTLTPDGAVAQSSATAALVKQVNAQAYALAFGDVFLSIALLLALSMLLVPLLPRPAPPATVLVFRGQS